MLPPPPEMGNGRRGVEQLPFSTQGRQVRMVLLTWPMIGLLGATVAAATCLFTDCDRCGRRLAKDTLVANVGSVKSTSFRPDSTMLSSVGVDGTVMIWDLETRPPSAYAPWGIGQVHCVAFSLDNRLLAAANANAVVTLYDLDRDATRALEDSPGSTRSARCVAFSPDSTTLAVGQADGGITIWDVASGRKRSMLGGHEEFVVALAFAPDGATLASSGNGRLTRIWDVPTGKERFSITGSMNAFVALSFSPDGRVLAMGDQVSPIVRLWDMTSGTDTARSRSERPGCRRGDQPRRHHAGRGRLSRHGHLLGNGITQSRERAGPAPGCSVPRFRCRWQYAGDRWIRRHDQALEFSAIVERVNSYSTRRIRAG